MKHKLFVIILTYLHKDKAPALMDAHRAWVQRGFLDGVFLLIAPILPAAGGIVIARNITRIDLQQFVASDPLVDAGILQAEILEIGSGRAIDSLAFLFN